MKLMKRIAPDGGLDGRGMKDAIRLDKVYRLAEIADVLRVSQVTLLRAIHARRLKAIRVGSQWRVMGSDLARYLNAETEMALNHDGRNDSEEQARAAEADP